MGAFALPLEVFTVTRAVHWDGYIANTAFSIGIASSLDRSATEGIHFVRTVGSAGSFTGVGAWLAYSTTRHLLEPETGRLHGASLISLLRALLLGH